MSAASTLTPAWFAPARSLAGGHSFGDADLVVQYVVHDGDGRPGEVVHHQRFVGGRLADWRAGPVDGAELCLRQPVTQHLRMLTRVELGEDVLAATEVVDPATGTATWPPLLDEVMVPWGRDAPEVATVEPFTVQTGVVGSPFGDVVLSVRVDRGRIAAVELGPDPEAEVVVWRPFDAAVLERLGRLDVLDSVGRGRVAGDLRKVTTFLGIYETEECIASRLALNGPWCEPLIALAGILTSPGWAEVAEGLVAASAQVWSVP